MNHQNNKTTKHIAPIFAAKQAAKFEAKGYSTKTTKALEKGFGGLSGWQTVWTVVATK